MTVVPIDLSIYDDEATLLKGLQEGDNNACAWTPKRFAPRVYAIALRLNHPQDAEEVTQETFISACKNIQNFEGRSSLGTWLHRIATNTALMHLRKQPPHQVSLDAPIQTLDGR